MRIGTRRSALALAQARLVAELLAAEGLEDSEIVPIATRGDRERAGANDDKSRWVAELEQALVAGVIDLAVHSAKDVPGELADGLELIGAPARAGAADVLCGRSALQDLGPGARVGTSSIRRLAQLRAEREDLEVVAIRGNVDTRLSKLADPGEGLDAIVLARAGLQRLGREREVGGVLPIERFVPAPGQGVLALEGRGEDESVREAVKGICDADAFACLTAERALARELGASCHTPLGAHCEATGQEGLDLRAWVGLPDGSAWIADRLRGERHDPEALGRGVAARIVSAGAQEMLQQAEEMARRPVGS